MDLLSIIGLLVKNIDDQIVVLEILIILNLLNISDFLISSFFESNFNLLKDGSYISKFLLINNIEYRLWVYIVAEQW